MTGGRLHLFGIRHHGPGSAASLEGALDALDPVVVLIEGPPEADPILAHAAASGMGPPVAILVHAADDPSRASFFPFAEYSPEWRAILWALARDRPVRFIDLPAAASLAGDDEADIGSGDRSAEEAGDQVALHGDPLSLLAEAAGHSDGESWWSSLVERHAHAPELFAAIEAAMTELRRAAGMETHDAREERREAHMRVRIAEVLKETDGPIAVVTGAWHVPALRRPAGKDDRAAIRNLPRTKTVATWVPWTDSRLAAGSGYAAGVVSPGWYRHLWTEFAAGRDRDPEAATARWQSRVAAMLREEGLPAATASVIEAARLADALAAIRGHSAPGLAEMRDASLAALCHGQVTPLSVIERRLVVGEAVGEIDDAVPQMPLAADLARWQRRTRLKPEGLERELALDLRSESGLLRSTLLHRLALVGVDWGRLVEGYAGRGTFRERWTLCWEPELSVRLAEALVWGPTIEQAAGNRAGREADEAIHVVDLAGLVERCLLADLGGPAELCIARLQALAANAADIGTLMRAAPPLASVLRYGTARAIPEEALRLLVTSLTEQVCAGLVLACRQLDADAAAEMARVMTGFDDAVRLLRDARLTEDWHRALHLLAADDEASPMAAGTAVRRLYDGGMLDGGSAAPYLSRALSPAVAPADAGAWLEGFLADAGQLLLHDRTLFSVIDLWLTGVTGDDFLTLLPMLRRAFSSIDGAERRRLLHVVRETEPSGNAEAAPAGAAASTEAERADRAFASALPLLHTILGIDAE